MKIVYWPKQILNFIRSNSKSRKWLILFALLTLIAAAASFQTYIVYDIEEHRNIGIYKNLVFNLPYWWFWLVLLPVISWLGKTFSFRKGNVVISGAVHLFVALVIIFVHQMLTSFWCNFTYGNLFYLPVMKKLVWRIVHLEWVFVDLVVYCAFLVGYFAIEYQQRNKKNELKLSRLETKLAQSQLQALRMQLHPHFLFNTLNALSTLILKGDILQANKMLVLFSEFLRITIDEPGLQEIPLHQELLFIERYLDVEKIRFQERLEVEMDISPNTLNIMVPNLILQPLVENAVKYAVAPRSSNGRISIRSRIRDEKLILQIQDNGPGLPAKIHQGIGLSNTSQRLKQMYPDESIFELKNLESGGLLVQLEIPVRQFNNMEEESIEFIESPEPVLSL